MNTITPHERLRIASEQMAGMQAAGYYANGPHVQLMVDSALESTDKLIKSCGFEVQALDPVPARRTSTTQAG